MVGVGQGSQGQMGQGIGRQVAIDDLMPGWAAISLSHRRGGDRAADGVFSQDAGIGRAKLTKATVPIPVRIDLDVTRPEGIAS